MTMKNVALSMDRLAADLEFLKTKTVARRAVVKNEVRVIGDDAVMLIYGMGQKFETVFDASDLPLVQAFPTRWMADGKSAARPYVHSRCRRDKKGLRVPLHRYIVAGDVGIPDGLVVDHINRDTLDNRRRNLRAVSSRVNSQNRKLSPGAVGIPNVSFSKARGTYVVTASFERLEDAAKASETLRDFRGY